MMKWDNVYGGLGILNTKIMNEALLLKWVWQIYNANENDMFCNLLREKYLSNHSFAKRNREVGSQFWRGLQKVKDRFYFAASFPLETGRIPDFGLILRLEMFLSS